MQTESSIRDPKGRLVLQSFASVTTSHNTCTYFDLKVYAVHNCVFIRILGDYLTDWVSLSMVLVYKTVFLKPIVRKVGIITWTLVQCCPRWGTALILSLLPFLWIQMCVPITPFQYQPESWQVFTTSAFRKPVFVYRSEKCLNSRLRLVCWI